MKKFILSLAIAAITFSTVSAQTKIDVSRNKVVKTRGANSNIKSDAPVVDMAAAQPAGYVPQVKAGTTAKEVKGAKYVKTRGINQNIRNDRPTEDQETILVDRKGVDKSRGENSNIKSDAPTADATATKPAGYVAKVFKNTTAKNVDAKKVVKSRGENPNIKKDRPSVDMEAEGPGM